MLGLYVNPAIKESLIMIDLPIHLVEIDRKAMYQKTEEFEYNVRMHTGYAELNGMPLVAGKWYVVKAYSTLAYFPGSEIEEASSFDNSST